MNSMEAELAQKEGYPAFMSAEHIALVLKKLPNGKGSGVQPPCPVLSSPDRTPLSLLIDEEGGEYA